MSVWCRLRVAHEKTFYLELDVRINRILLFYSPYSQITDCLTELNKVQHPLSLTHQQVRSASMVQMPGCLDRKTSLRNWFFTSVSQSEAGAAVNLLDLSAVVLTENRMLNMQLRSSICWESFRWFTKWVILKWPTKEAVSIPVHLFVCQQDSPKTTEWFPQNLVEGWNMDQERIHYIFKTIFFNIKRDGYIFYIFTNFPGDNS